MSQSSFDSSNITELLSGRMCIHSSHLKSQLNLVYFIKFLMLKTFNPLTTNDWGSFDKGALCVCVCLRPFTVKASSVWGWNSR